MMRHVRVTREFFPPRERRAIEQLACTDPKTVGWQITHWSHRSLAKAAVEQEVVGSISHATVGNVLRKAKLQPHRFRYWKTTVWDDEAVARTLKILWYYRRIQSLWQRGEVVLAVDEKPNIQVLERAAPNQSMQPGQIERQEFEYQRHGTLILLAGLTVYNGHMWANCLDKNDGAHFRPALRRLLHPYSRARRIHLIMDNGSSHTSDDTCEFFAELSPRVQVMFTPANASWLNQAEALLQAFSHRYLIRASWASRAAMTQHVLTSAGEYNQRFAHPFEWQWSCQDFLYWLNNTPGLIRCIT
jgi:DDE superfamily endonuclease